MNTYEEIIEEFDEIRKKLTAGEISVEEAEALHDNLGKRTDTIRAKLKDRNAKQKEIEVSKN